MIAQAIVQAIMTLLGVAGAVEPFAPMLASPSLNMDFVNVSIENSNSTSRAMLCSVGDTVTLTNLRGYSWVNTTDEINRAWK